MPAQRRASDLESRVAAINPSEFLPARLVMGRQPLEASIRFDQLDLGLGRRLLVLEDARWWTSALVEEGEGFRRARAGDGIAEEPLLEESR